MMAKDSASRSVTAPMRESLMDSPVVTSLSPVEMVDVQSVMVCLAALWQLWMFCMAVSSLSCGCVMQSLAQAHIPMVI